MSEVPPLEEAALPLTQALRIDALCDRFEMAWKAGQRPQIEEYLGDVAEPDRSIVLRELIALEIHYRCRAGEAVQPDEYHARFPALDPKTQPEVPAARRDQAGDTPAFIGKYRVVERLGSGGQAEVFRAVHPTLGRDVVLKWAHQSLPEPARQKLIDEGKVLARLDDPGLVRVYDVDLHEGRPFVVFEYLSGRSLAERLKEGRPAPRQAAALVADLAGTLARVHRQGVLHRDLKPGNVLIDPTGRPRLLDFGLATLVQPWSAINLPESGVSGTLQYMAPEQANGQTEQIGPRTDVFGLGALFYELLTGRPPYQGPDLQSVWEQARRAQITPPRQLNSRTPRSLERICRKALAADPEQRYRSAAEMELVLGGYLRRPRRLAAGLGLVGLLLATVLLVFFHPWTPFAGESMPPPAAVPLSGELIVRVWAPDRNKRGLKVGEDPGALPVRNGEMLHLQARLNQPAYVYLLWLDGQGKLDPLYPWDRSFDKLPAELAPQEELHSPPELHRGWPMEGPSGLETILLLVRRHPLPADVKLAEVIGELKPSPLRDPHEVAVRGFDPGQPTGWLDLGEHRGPGAQAAEIDEPLLQLMERLRPHFEMIRAVRFAHQAN